MPSVQVVEANSAHARPDRKRGRGQVREAAFPEPTEKDRRFWIERLGSLEEAVELSRQVFPARVLDERRGSL
jgi:hypothetical protein